MNFLLRLTIYCFVAYTFTSAHVSAQSQAEMNQEAAANFKKADAELNRTYSMLLASLDDEARAKLKAAQRAWVVFRDAEAEYQMDAEARGGSMASMIYEGTRARLTKQRIAQLKEQSGNPR